LYKKLAAFVSEESIQGYEQCLELNPRHVLALWNLGRIYDGDYDHVGHGSDYDEFHCANKEKAIECFTRIIEIDPKYSKAYYRLARIY
jgi:tetratricopeptide (TPR) repeat protein